MNEEQRILHSIYWTVLKSSTSLLATWVTHGKTHLNYSFVNKLSILIFN